MEEEKEKEILNKEIQKKELDELAVQLENIKEEIQANSEKFSQTTFTEFSLEIDLTLTMIKRYTATLDKVTNDQAVEPETKVIKNTFQVVHPATVQQHAA